MLSFFHRRLLFSGLVVGLLHPAAVPAADEVQTAPRQGNVVAKSHTAGAGSDVRRETSTLAAKTAIVQSSAAPEIVRLAKVQTVNAKAVASLSREPLDITPTKFDDLRLAPPAGNQKNPALLHGTRDAQEKIELETRSRESNRKQVDASKSTNETKNDVRVSPPQGFDKQSVKPLDK
jgi:hypothetical protein